MDDLIGKTASDCTADVWKALRNPSPDLTPTEQRTELHVLIKRYMTGLTNEVTTRITSES